MRHELPEEDEFEQAADFIEDIDAWTDERRDAFLAWIAEKPSPTGLGGARVRIA